MGNLTTNLIVWLIKSKRFSLQNRTKCISALLNKLNFIPYKDIIETDGQGRTLIEGRPLDFEKAKQVREGAKAILDNPIRKLVRDQVAFRAVNIGVHNGDTPEKVYFSRVALWVTQQEEELLEILAGE